MNLKDIPIQRKLTTVMVFTSAVAVILAVLAFSAYEVLSFRKNLLRTGRTLAEITAAQTSAAVDFGDADTASDILSKLRAEPTVVQAAIFDRDGKALARYPASMAATAFPSEQAPGAHFEPKGLHIFQPIEVDEKIIGMLYMRWDLAPAYARLRFYGLMSLAILAGSVLIALQVSRWMQERISQPILDLAETARAVSVKKDYQARATKRGNDELGELTDAFNHMLTQLQERDAALRENQGQLQAALNVAQQSAEAVRALNSELERRVQARTAELQAANGELEAFTYSVSHDLRAPLRHIDAYAQILEEDHGAKLNEEAKGAIERIRHGVQNMGQLVDDLLNLSRLGRADLQKQMTALKPLVEEAVADLRAETLRRNIDWRIGELPSVFCDAGLVKQVFVNLLSNAVKYTRPRDPAVVEVGETLVDNVKAFFVRDNGVGFNMKYSSKLFGVFQRLHRVDEFEGTGVGLATVQRIVERHGGKIWAEAELDKGATFYFTLEKSASEGTK